MNAIRRVRALVLCGGLAGLTACASGSLRVADITPEQIPALEAQRAAKPGDATVLSRLGVAYFKAQRYSDAQPPLDTASRIDPQNAIAAIYLGMTAEQLGDFPAARAAYQHFISVSHSRALRHTAEQRLALVDRRALEYQARQALAAESTLTTEPPQPNTIAVMPFAYTGANTQIQPLSRGLAELLVTDLARSPRLHVLERDRMQAMLDEMHLSEQGEADPQTAVRSGHLLRAERVVQGSLTGRGNELRVDATVVDVSSAGVVTPPSESDQLDRLFDIEKRLAFGIFAQLGIPLTASDSVAISQRPTENLQAFLAFSRGLEDEDQGNYDAARSSYAEAAQLDPGFAAARQNAASATDLSAAASQSVTQVEAVVVQNASAETGGVPSNLTQQVLTSTTNTTNGTPTGQQNSDAGPSNGAPSNRDPGPEVTHTDTPGQTQTTIPIVIKRPQ